jgi:NAD(P)-dependent dehydrogenase (short-subunit alcohol dehydrogenase family)
MERDREVDMSRAGLVIGAGASAGVGGALARRFAREGLHTFVAGRTPEKVEALAEELRSSGGVASAIVADCTDEASTVQMFDAVEKESGGPPELVVYNAGNNRFSPLLDMTPDFVEELWRVCALGGFLSGREAARRMIPAGGGTLIFTGATASIRARPPFTAFASAKAAERAFAHGMAREFGPQGLHVAHVIIDGVIDGDQVNSRFPQIRERLGDDGMLSVDSIADAFWGLHVQEKTAWTLELDLRPYKEQF